MKVYAMVYSGKLALSRDFAELLKKASPGAKIRPATPLDVTRWLGEHPNAPKNVVAMLKFYKEYFQQKAFEARQAKAEYALEQSEKRIAIARKRYEETVDPQWTEYIEAQHQDWLDDKEQEVALSHGQA